MILPPAESTLRPPPPGVLAPPRGGCPLRLPGREPRTDGGGETTLGALVVPSIATATGPSWLKDPPGGWLIPQRLVVIDCRAASTGGSGRVNAGRRDICRRGDRHGGV